MGIFVLDTFRLSATAQEPRLLWQQCYWSPPLNGMEQKSGLWMTQRWLSGSDRLNKHGVCRVKESCLHQKLIVTVFPTLSDCSSGCVCTEDRKGANMASEKVGGS